MRERILILGGILNIKGEKNIGTIVDLKIPL
jgi:signal transduction histidine kinase